MVMRVYVDLKTDNAKRRDMIKATLGVFPFDGNSGVYGQAGRQERYSGQWRIHAIKDLFEDYACGAWDADKLTNELLDIEEEMRKGLHELELVGARSGLGGGSAWGPMVDEFIRHVAFLASRDNHLYSAFQ